VRIQVDYFDPYYFYAWKASSRTDVRDPSPEAYLLRMEVVALADPDNMSGSEIEAALQSLTNEDQIRIRVITRANVSGLRAWDIDDIINETIKRLLEGKRHIKRGKHIVLGIAEIMSSIAYDQWKHENKYELDSALVDDPEGDSEDTLATIRLEKRLIALPEQLGNDPAAQRMLQFLVEDWQKNEIMQEMELTETQYDSKRKAIRRAVLGLGKV